MKAAPGQYKDHFGFTDIFAFQSIGIILMGVLDNGEVNGLMMSPFQQHHFILNVHETFGRFSPKVPDHFFKIRFVPLLEPGEFDSNLTSLPICDLNL